MIVNKSIEQGRQDSILGKVITLLNNSDPLQRKKAVYACARIANSDALNMLVKAYQKETFPALKELIIKTLASLGNEIILVKIVYPLLKSCENKETLLNLIPVLAKRKDINSAAQILPFLLSKDQDIRSAAAAALKLTGRAFCIKGLIEMSNCQDREIRKLCADVLAGFPVREGTLILEKLLSDNSDSVKKTALSNLQKMASNSNANAIQILKNKGLPIYLEKKEPTRKVPQMLLSKLASLNIQEKIDTIDKIISIGGKEALEILKNRLEDEVDNESIAALIKGIGSLGNTPEVSILKSYIFNPDPWIRAAAVNALMNADKTESMPLAALCLKDPVPEVKIAACKAMANYPHIDIEIFIKELLYSNSESEQAAGVRLISELKNPALFHLFIHETVKKSPHILNLCIKSLEQAENYYPEAEEMRNSLKSVDSDAVKPADFKSLDQDLFTDFSMSEDDPFEGIMIPETQFEEPLHMTKNSNIKPSSDNKVGSKGEKISVSPSAKISLMAMGIETADSESAESANININSRENLKIQDLIKSLKEDFKLFFSKNEDDRKKYIFSIRNNITEKNYNFIISVMRKGELSEPLKRLCEKTVKSFENRLDIKDYNIDSYFDITQSIPAAAELKVGSLSYEGGKSWTTLKSELKEREKMYQVRNFWEGSFPRSKVLLNCLRLDTQEMILKTLSDNEKPDLAFMLLYNDNIADFANAVKSPDSASADDHFQNIANSEIISKPLYSLILEKISNPRYCLFITSISKIIIFMRSQLEEKLSYYVEIPFSRIDFIDYIHNNNKSSILIEMNKKVIEIFGFRSSDLELAKSKLNSRIKMKT
jgi:HEAT repeat protein